MTDYLAAHPELVAAIAVAVLVHLRAAMPPAQAGTAYGLLLTVWDLLAGNYGRAKNKDANG